MVTFDKEFRQRMRDRLERFSRFDQRGNIRSKISVTVKKGDNLFSEAKSENQDFSWKADEAGPSPLSYFISSLGLCQMVHYGEHFASSNLELASLSIKVDGEFTVSRPRAFTKITYHVYLESGEEIAKLKGLAATASSDCYVTNTLRKSCEVEGLLNVNGIEVGRIEV